MDYKETYDKFWQNGVKSDFSDYSRNFLLADYFPEATANESVCDIAGGSGVISEWLKKRGYDVTLLEFSPVAIEAARQRGIEKIVAEKIESDQPLPFKDGEFDYIFLGDIIEHMFDGEHLIKESLRILKNGGRLVLSCPNIAYWRFRTYYLLDGDFERIDVAKQKPWEQEHIRFYNLRILKEFLSKSGFEFVKFSGDNQIWHSKFLAKIFPNLFALTLVAEFKKKD